MWALLGIAAVVAYFAMHGKGASATTENPNGLPWFPPGLGNMLPIQTKFGDVSLTPFPVNVWQWSAPSNLAPLGTKFILAIASTDPTSYVALVQHPSGSTPPAAILAQGPGPNTATILQQV